MDASHIQIHDAVAFLDGDDWWAAGKLSRVAEILQASPELGMVGHGTITVFDDGSTQTEVLEKGRRFSLRSAEGAEMF